MTTASHHEVCGICHLAGPCEHNAPELPQALTLRQWVDGWTATELMSVQVANIFTMRLGGDALDQPFDRWAADITARKLRKLRGMGNRSVAQVASLLRLSGYELRGYVRESDPTELLNIKPGAARVG